MSILELLAIALAFSVESMIVIYKQASSSIRLTRGLVYALTFGLAYAFMLLAGILTGGILRFEDSGTATLYNHTNTLVFIGLTLVAIIKQLFALRSKNNEQPTFDISRISTFLALAAASGITPLIVGLGIGFLPVDQSDPSTAALLTVTAVFLLTIWGIMLKRQHVALRTRRWGILSTILLLGVIIYRITIL